MNETRMPGLLADRFLPCGAAWIDLATGATVRIRLAEGRSRGDMIAWNDWCATLAVLRHPALNVLVDYGHADATRTFEAYSVSPPLAAPGAAGTRLLTHAVRFLEAHGVYLRRAVAELAVRQVEARASRGPRRPFGIVLQPRRALLALEEALDDVRPGGPAVLAIEGETGAGLRTAWLHLARLARLHGYLPLSAAVLGSAPWLIAALRERHLCVLVDRAAAGSLATAARLAARLGVESARRHIVMRFERTPAAGDARLRLEPLGVTAMLSMVFRDCDEGPDEPELLAAARLAEGNPGRFLSLLRASAFPEHRPSFSVVHETAPAYVVEGEPDAARRSLRRPMPRSIVSAEERAVRLAARGRHASAIRLLTRATRVLELRGERGLAAQCAERLGWILRDRGRTHAALEAFARCAGLARGGPLEVRATIGTGVTWTDECRFGEGEAALRGAAGAAALLADAHLEPRARLALARCLYWQRRHDEAAATLAPCLQATEAEVVAAARTLSARIHAARGHTKEAAASASDALAAARTSNPRALASAARAMALAQKAIGDLHSARTYITEGLSAAAAARAPLLALRLRAVARDLHPAMPGESKPRVSRPVQRRSIPPLVALQLETGGVPAPAPAPRQFDGLPSPALEGLQRFLEIAYTAPDDRAGVDAICDELCTALRAATVQVIAADSERRLVARAGRPWTGDLSLTERALASRPAWPVVTREHPHEAAHPITYTGAPIAVLACRWTMAMAIDVEAAAGLLCTGSLALAPGVRAVLDRAQTAPPETVWRDLIGASPPTLALREAIARAARAPFPVLIEGESGSGKELVARAIHGLCARRDRRFCAVNCAAISDELLEAELFGHARGAFTGAVGERAGLFEEADGGTLFLDEVGELSPRAQAKLLRVLQDGEVRRVGESFARRVDARVIAATNRPLAQEVEQRRFREDLWFRLDVVRIGVPPLRDRPLDIPLLAAHFWEDAARRVDSRASLAPETTLALTRYEWPGNVRQLQNVIASLAVHAPRRGRVPPSLLPAQVARAAAAAAHTFEAARADFERRFILAELARAGGQRAGAARALGVTRQGLAKMMRRLGIDTRRPDL